MTRRQISRTVAVSTAPQTAPRPSTAQVPVSQAPSQSRLRRGSTASTCGTQSQHISTRHRAESAPHRVPTMLSQSPTSRSARLQTVAVPSTAGTSRSGPIPRIATPLAGESDAYRSCALNAIYEHSMTSLLARTKAGTRALIPTMQVLSNHTKYVARFRHISHFRLMPLKI